jgi:hypothetical protein
MITKGKRYSLLGYPGPKGEDGVGPAVKVGTLVLTNGTIEFVNSNSITWGLATNGSLTASFSQETVAGGGGNWATATKTGSDIQISTGVTNTLHYGKFITTYTPGGEGGGMGLNTAITGGSMTGNSSGLSINLPNYLTTAAQSVHTHDYQSTGAYLTTAAQSVHTHDYQSTGAYLTTAAQSGHTHSDLYQSTGAYLTTAMQSASSSVFAKTGITTASTAGSDLAATHNTDGLSLGVPKWLTAAVGGGGAAVSMSAGNMTSAGSGYSNVSSGTLFLAGGNNITLSQNGANITISGANVGGAQTGISGMIVSDATYSSGTVLFSNVSNITISSSVNGGSQYIKLSVADAMLTGERANYYYTSANTLANSTHGHGNISISATSNSTETAIRMTSASSGFTFVQPSFITTAAASGHTHGAGATASTAGSDLVITSASNSWQFGIPKWITTYAAGAATDHSHGNVSISATSNSTETAMRFTSASSGFTIVQPSFLTTAAVSNHDHTNKLGSGTTIATTAGVILKVTADSNGLNISYPNAITTAAASDHTHGVFSISATSNSTETAIRITSNSSGFTFVQPSFITTAMASNESHYSATSQLSATFAQTANVMLTGERASYQYTSANTKFASKFSLAGANTAGTTTQNISDQLYLSGDNMMTLSADGSTIKFSVNTASLVGTGALASLQYTSANTKFFQGYSLEGAQTAGSTVSGSASRIYLSGGNMMTLSGNQNTIVFSVNTASLVGTGALGSLQYTSANTAFFQGYSLEGNTSGSTVSGSASRIYLSGGNNITLSGNQNTIVISAGAGGGGIAMSLSGNSTSAGGGYSNITSGTAILAGGDNITLSQNGSRISIIGATANGPASMYFSDNDKATWSSSTNGSSTTVMITSLGAGGGAALKGSGTYSQNTGTIEFANSNGITFGLTANSMTASVSVSAATGSIYFGNISGYSFTSSTEASKTTFYIKTA